MGEDLSLERGRAIGNQALVGVDEVVGVLAEVIRAAPTGWPEPADCSIPPDLWRDPG